MADLQAALSEAVKLNRSISQFLKFSTYTVSAPMIKCKKTPRKKCSFVAEVKGKR